MGHKLITDINAGSGRKKMIPIGSAWLNSACGNVEEKGQNLFRGNMSESKECSLVSSPTQQN